MKNPDEKKPTRFIDWNGTVRWRLPDGKLHRTDGPAVEYVHGTKAWYLNGELHRIDGPAIERANGYKAWFLNGELHRTDGPAIEDADGSKSWWLNDQKLDPEEHIKSNDGKYPELVRAMIIYEVMKT